MILSSTQGSYPNLENFVRENYRKIYLQVREASAEEAGPILGLLSQRLDNCQKYIRFLLHMQCLPYTHLMYRKDIYLALVA